MDWLLTLIALLWPIAFLMPGCPCCGVACGSSCSSTPTSVTITATGFTNAACTSCADYNATYILPRDGSLPALCQFTQIDDKGCKLVGNNDSASASFVASGSDTEFRAQVVINGPSGTPRTHVYWTTILGPSPFACGGYGTFMCPINTIFIQTSCSHDSSDLEVTIA